jgi:hypothetical protein
MPCPSCTAAAKRVSGLFSADCRGCCARAVSRSPQFRRSQELGRLDSEYRRLLEQFKLTHEEVKDAHAIDASSREKA